MNRMLRIIPDCFPLNCMKNNIPYMGVQVKLIFMNKIQIYRKCMAQFNYDAITVIGDTLSSSSNSEK